MKVSIFSDCHCGYGLDTERENDSFQALSESVERSIDSDLILIAGDIFDSRIPKQEVFAKTAKILSRAKHNPSRIRLVELKGKDNKDISPLALSGVPIICIHGTHERRSKYMLNPIEALEHVGLIIHLDRGTAVFEIENAEDPSKSEKIAIHGMSGMPERYAGRALKEWNPKPVPGAKNILMLHQSVDPYIYSPLEPPSIKLADLPDGFDVYILGHMHWWEIKNFKQGHLVLTGSTNFTSIRKNEAEQKKSIFSYNGKFVEALPLKFQRKIIWEEFIFSETLKEDIEKKIKEVNIQSDIKPIFVVKLSGDIPKGVKIPSLTDIEQEHKDRFIFNINKNFNFKEFEDNKEILNNLKTFHLSPEEQGISILKDKLFQANCNINIAEIFELLYEGKSDMLFDIMMGHQMQLNGF